MAAPDIPEPPNYFFFFFLNNAFNFPMADDARPLVVDFLRRWEVAVREYREGRERLLKFVADLSQTNNQIGLFLQALSNFEHSVIDAYLALMAMDGMGRLYDKNHERPFKLIFDSRRN